MKTESQSSRLDPYPFITKHSVIVSCGDAIRLEESEDKVLTRNVVIYLQLYVSRQISRTSRSYNRIQTYSVVEESRQPVFSSCSMNISITAVLC